MTREGFRTETFRGPFLFRYAPTVRGRKRGYASRRLTMRGPDGAISKGARRAMSFIGASLAKSAGALRQPRNNKVSKRRRGLFIKRERDAICATFDLHDFLAVVISPGRRPWSFGLA